MGLEIERKFLVRGDGYRALATPVYVSQGYLLAEPRAMVRVRVAGDRAFLTVKGPTEGIGRAEYEYPIPPDDARAMLATLCAGPRVEKHRYVVPHAGHTWDVDEFLGDNAGLVVAEVELAREDEPFERPEWLGAEVTGDPRYYNSALARSPFRTWPR